MKLFPDVAEAPLPDGALLQEFADRGDYTDCFAARVPADAGFPACLEAFYTTRLFKVERIILKRLVSMPSTDTEAAQLSRGDIQTFAAWTEYKRRDDQLVMMDFRQQTCSWFMLAKPDGKHLLYFGSAILRDQGTASGRKMSWRYRSLLGFHRLYSRALLQAAVRRLRS